MYHQKVKQLSMPALHLPLSMSGKPRLVPDIRQWHKVLLILGSLQLLHSFTALQGGQNRWHFTSAAKASPSNGGKNAASTPAATIPAKQFSFEYDGLLQFRIVVTENTDNGFIPAIQITTTLHQPDR